jgi:hypothetical protein
MANVIPIRLLRSSVADKRPDPDRLESGQPAVNTNAEDPGLFISATDTSVSPAVNSLVKIGPCSIRPTPPNSGAVTPGDLGNSKGELWLDTSAAYGAVLKVYDGTNWINCLPFTFAVPVVSETAPVLANYPDGTLWWNSTNGLMYILYNDGTSRQWTQVTSSVSPV